MMMESRMGGWSADGRPVRQSRAPPQLLPVPAVQA